MNERFNQDRNDSDDAPDMRELDALLRDWHTENMDAAKTGRDRLLAALSANKPAARSKSLTAATAVHNRADDNGHTMLFARLRASGRLHQWRTLAARFSPAAAAILLIAVLIAFNPSRQQRTHADVIYAPEGGALTALDEAGRVKGPCPLKDTYVDVDISGRFARVTLWQTFHNPYHEKIEAVYTFPMGHDGAVDRMTMSIGDRVIVGEVHEREQAKEIYNTAKQQGHVAALLEQERPNIFTQSVANIEPGAEILVEISYVETITPSDGVCEFAFPMTVAPRYIPSSDDRPLGDAGRFATPRDGVNLLAPGRLQAVEKTELVLFNAPSVSIESATPIDIVDATAWESDADGEATTEVASFVVDYEDVPDEQGAIYSNGTGYVGNRWFAFDRNLLQHGTSAVPDAPRITPPAAAPGTRAGHDISIGVTLDTGGPGITDLETPLHATIVRNEAFNADGLPTRSTIDLADVADIPNRDFVLRWRPMTEEITDSVLAHTSDLGNFVTIMIDPPSRVEANDLVPRELVFVIDTSGSMKGQPLDKARQVMANALESMGPNDTFNVIAFSDNATRLWDSPREATTENIDEAHVFVMKHDSNGGTEMMNAVRMALSSEVADRAAIFDDLTKVFNAIHLDELAQSQADGRFVVVRLEPNDLVQLRPESGDDPYMAAIRFADESTLYVRGLRQPVDSLRPGMSLILMGSLHSDADGYDYIELDEFGPTKRPAGTIAPSQLATLPADDRRVSVLVKCEEVDGYTDRRTGEWIEGVRTSNDEFIEFDGFQIHDHDDASAMLLTGRWTGGEDPRFVVEAGIHVPREWAEPSPLRVVCFLTDGEVGNDMSIIDEIRNTAGRTRFFSMGIGNSVNRFLLDGMAEAGRGAGDVITLEDDAHAAVERFVQRMRSPVLLNPSIEFSDGLDIVDMLPAALPDLFDERPIVIHARYVLPGTGTITIRGDAADGPFEKTIDVELPEFEPQNTVLPALWARAKVDSIMNRDLKAAQQNAFPDEWRQEVIDIGETFQIMTQYTSFVAVEQLRVTLGGEPTRIHVPVEPPDGTTPESDVAQQLLVNAAGYEAWPDEVSRQIVGERYYLYQQAVQAASEVIERENASDDSGISIEKPTLDISEFTTSRPNMLTVLDDQNGRQDPEEYNRRTEQKLSSHVANLHFDGARLEDVFAELRRQTNLNIVPAWSPMEAVAIEKGSEISLDLTDVSYQEALEAILDQVGGREVKLGYRIDEGIIRISTAEHLQRTTPLAMYDINNNDLPISIPEFRGPADSTTASSGESDAEDGSAADIHDIDSDGLPDHENITNPENWPEIAARRQSTEELRESESTRRARDVLNTRADELRFDRATFEEVIDTLRTRTNLDIVPGWRAMEDVAIERDAEVSLELTDVTYKKALELILDEISGGEVDLEYEIDDGIVRISTSEDISGHTQVHVYNVQDLLLSIPEKEAGTGNDEAGANANTDKMQTLIDLIQSVVAPESWQDFGGNTGSVATLNDQLVVTQTSNNHHKLQRLLADLRLRQSAAAGEGAEVSEDMKTQIPEMERIIETEPEESSQGENRSQSTHSGLSKSERIALIQQTKERQIRELMDRATEYRKEGRLGDSVQVLDQILVIQPDQEQALWMRDTLEDLAQSIRDREVVGERKSQSRDLLIENDLSGIPYHDNMKYPKNWPKIAARRLTIDEWAAEEGNDDPADSEGLLGDTVAALDDDAFSDKEESRPMIGAWSQFDTQHVDLALGGRSDACITPDAGPPAQAFGQPFGKPGLVPTDASAATTGKRASPIVPRSYLAERTSAGGISGGRFVGQGGGLGGGGRGSGRGISTQTATADPTSVNLWTTVVRDSTNSPKQYIAPTTTNDRANDAAAFAGTQTQPFLAFGQPSGVPVAPSNIPADIHVAAESYDATPTAGLSITPATAGGTGGFRPVFFVDARDSVTRADSAGNNDSKIALSFGTPTLSAGRDGQLGEVPERIEVRGSSSDDNFGRVRDKGVSSMTPDPNGLASLSGYTIDTIPALDAVSSPSVSDRVAQSVQADAAFDPVYFFSRTTTADDNSADSTMSFGIPYARTSTSAVSDTLGKRLFEDDTSAGQAIKPGTAGADLLVDARIGRDFLGYDSRVNPVSPADTSNSTKTLYADTSNTDAPEFLATAGLDVSTKGIATGEPVAELELGDSLTAGPDGELIIAGPDASSEELKDAPNDFMAASPPMGSQKRAVFALRDITPEETRALIEKLRTDDRSIPGNTTATRTRPYDSRGRRSPAARGANASQAELGEEAAPKGTAKKFVVRSQRDAASNAASAPETEEAIASFDRNVESHSFDNFTLESAMEQLGDDTKTTVAIDALSLHAAGYGCDSTFTAATEAGPLADALATILAACSGDGEPLDFVATRDGTLITTQSTALRMLGLATITYDIADFFATADLPDAVQLDDSNASLPPNWRMGAFLVNLTDANALSHAGRVRTGAVIAGDRVTITQSPAFHRSLAAWLSELRTARFEAPSTALSVYQLAARIRAGLAGADDVIALLDTFPTDRLARELLDAVLGEHADIVGPPPSLSAVLADAAKELDAAAARSKRIAACLDAPLLGLMAGKAPAASDRRNGLIDPRIGPDGVTVSVLLADSQSATLAAVKGTGLQVESVVSAANVVVGEIPLSRLADLSVLPGVRRVEATR